MFYREFGENEYFHRLRITVIRPRGAPEQGERRNFAELARDILEYLRKVVEVPVLQGIQEAAF